MNSHLSLVGSDLRITMMKSLILLVCCLVLVNGALVKQSVSTGDCVCATTNVHGRDKGSVSGSIITTISSGNCGKIYGGIVTADGYTWYEITYNSQRMWVAGNYLTASEASRCDTSVTASGGCPAIISRSQWGARSPKSRSYLQNPVQYLFIHHAESGDCHDQASCASLVRGFQNFHMDTRGWSDIAYTFLVGGDGSVFEGRGWDRVGAHTKGYNSVGYAICFIGNFMNHAPTDIQVQRAKELISCGLSNGKLKSSYTLRGHRDVGSTDCPGDVLYKMIQNWPHY